MCQSCEEVLNGSLPENPPTPTPPCLPQFSPDRCANSHKRIENLTLFKSDAPRLKPAFGYELTDASRGAGGRLRGG